MTEIEREALAQEAAKEQLWAMRNPEAYELMRDYEIPQGLAEFLGKLSQRIQSLEDTVQSQAERLAAGKDESQF